MAMTSKLVYKQGFGPLATDVYRVAGAVSVPRHLDRGCARGLDLLFQPGRRPAVRSPASCSSPCRARAASSRCRRSSCRRSAGSATSTGSSTSTTRCRPAAAAPARCGRSSATASSPTCSSRGKTLGGGLPLAAVTGRAELMDAVHVGGLGGTFGGNPVACAAALAVLDELSAPGFRERAEQVGSLLRTRLEEIATRQPIVGEVRGLGPMLALELREPTPRRREGDDCGAREKGLLLLSCGLYGNVIRLLPPLSAIGRGARARARHPGGGTWRRGRRARLRPHRSRRLRRSG